MLSGVVSWLSCASASGCRGEAAAASDGGACGRLAGQRVERGPMVARCGASGTLDAEDHRVDTRHHARAGRKDILRPGSQVKAATDLELTNPQLEQQLQTRN